MITFSPNGPNGMVINGEQMRTVTSLMESDKSGWYELCELESGALELYVGNAFHVGDEYHRYYIDTDGGALSPEYCTVTYDNGDWSWDW